MDRSDHGPAPVRGESAKTDTLRAGAPRARRLGYVALVLWSTTPWATPPTALAAGALLGLTTGNPFPASSARAGRWLLQASVVGLGFGMPIGVVLRAGASGAVYTVAGLGLTLVLGLLLGQWLRVERETSVLITAGTGICGGSAIAAVGPAIAARSESMTVSLATVFVLNAVALYLFPAIGRLLGLGEAQFGVWAAVAIHDTSSVIGAAAAYGPRALEGATVLKLARALWIVPVTLGAALLARSWRPAGRDDRDRPVVAVRPLWFIGFFLLAVAARSLVPEMVVPLLDGIARLARQGLVVTLFLIGADLSRDTLRAVGVRPLVHGLLLWVAVAGLSLYAVWRWVPT